MIEKFITNSEELAELISLLLQGDLEAIKAKNYKGKYTEKDKYEGRYAVNIKYYEFNIGNEYLDKFKIIKGKNIYEIAEKAKFQLEMWARQEEKKKLKEIEREKNKELKAQEKEEKKRIKEEEQAKKRELKDQKQAEKKKLKEKEKAKKEEYLAERLKTAEEKTQAAQQQLTTLASLLQLSLETKLKFSWDSFKKHEEFKIPRPKKLALPDKPKLVSFREVAEREPEPREPKKPCWEDFADKKPAKQDITKTKFYRSIPKKNIRTSETSVLCWADFASKKPVKKDLSKEYPQIRTGRPHAKAKHSNLSQAVTAFHNQGVAKKDISWEDIADEMPVKKDLPEKPKEPRIPFESIIRIISLL